ncbi:hypothetical protein BLNAU_23088 [Blattamonas nauphoetae]|uniref:Uncharacterized protein n=1 Tax=Blattamonas nauphoetae TaxID=2049346 RepID=A0ABQ9WR91_9EUKA|nr:hypothetical protein BLNAU_23088 [Blattamonas nauphoetae]
MANLRHHTHESSIQIPLGNYHIENYIVSSTSLSLNGYFSTISSQSSINSEEFDEKRTVPLLVAENSTLSLSQLVFDCRCVGSTVATVESSTVVVLSSRFISNPQTSPFVVTSGAGTLGSTITLIACSHSTPDSSMLLPFVTTSPQLSHRQYDTSASLAPTSSSLVTSFLSVYGSDLTLEDSNLVLRTGPLLDFGASNQDISQTVGLDVGDITTSLSGSVLSNVTTSFSTSHKLRLPSSLHQHLLGNTVTRSTHHLSGTSCLDMNVFGSLSCRNTSFSHCHTNLEPSSDYPSFVLQHYASTARQYIDKPTPLVKITFTLCTFLSMTSVEYGAAVRIAANSDVSFTECSFKSISGDFGGTLYLSGGFNEYTVTLTISLTSFVACTATDFGQVYAANCRCVTITETFFFDCETTDTRAFGGAFALSKISLLVIDECAFRTCEARDGNTAGGGGYMNECPSLTISSTQFRGCFAKRGSDLFFSDCGTPTELKTKVKNCYTDSPGTSVFEVGADAVVPDVLIAYDTPTTVTRLALKPEPNIFSAPVEVTLAARQLWNSPNCKFGHTSLNHSSARMSDLIRFGRAERFQFGGIYKAYAASAPIRPTDISSKSFIIADDKRLHSFNSKLGTKLGEMLVSLEARGLTVGDFVVSFKDKPGLSLTFTFTQTMVEPDNQVSKEISVGPFGTNKGFFPGETYEVSSIEGDFTDGVKFETPKFSLVMPSYPETYTFGVDKSKGDTDGSCRVSDDTCGTLDSALSTVDLLRIKNGILKLGTIDPLSTPQVVGSGREVSMSPNGSGQSSVVISSSFPSSESQVMTVSGGSLKFANVDVTLLSSSLTLKLVKVTDGAFEMKDGSIKRDASSTANSFFGHPTPNDDVCSWSGVVELIDSTGSFISCNITNHQNGAIAQSGGSVTIKNVFFESNGAPYEGFPSARQNVFCSGDGQLEVTELTGDGKDEASLFPGISAADCSVAGETTTMSLPTVDVEKSKVTLDKKTKSYVAEIAGSAFTPCGLSIEVFAILKNGSEEVTEPLILNVETATIFTETAITTSIPASHMENLTKNVAWTLRLKNGDERLSSQSLVLRKKPANNVWMIPFFIILFLAIVAAVVVVVIVLWRRKNKKAVNGSVEAQEQAGSIPQNTPPTSETAEAEPQAAKSEKDNNTP